MPHNTEIAARKIATGDSTGNTSAPSLFCNSPLRSAAGSRHAGFLMTWFQFFPTTACMEFKLIRFRINGRNHLIFVLVQVNGLRISSIW
jgi:hypothetical protein